MSNHLAALAHLSPDAAIAALTLGTLLIYLELNRPGWILPGTLGLLLDLFAAASLSRFQLYPAAIALLATAIALLSVDLFRPLPRFLAAAGILAITLGIPFLIRRPVDQPVHFVTNAFCALILGATTSLLTGVARRARSNKRVRLRKSAF